MTEDQRKFVILKKKGGNVAFGDDSSNKILGKGILKLRSQNVKEIKVLLVEYLKHNLLNFNKICDQGYPLTFDSLRKIGCNCNKNTEQHIYPTNEEEREEKTHKKGLQGRKSPKYQK
jgi:hypothetical protein